ncbi:hypothetical protein JHK84_041269 [Glycine max]|nr:hypothetical protein JHK84_041269 [Glycine max]
MDTVISQAQATLGFQRSTVDGINSKLSNVSSRLPTCESETWFCSERLLEISSVGDIA